MAARKKTKSAKSKVSASTTSPQYSFKGFPLDLKNLITIIFLVVCYPIGVILMFLWVRWPFWVKMVIAIPMTLFFIIVLLPLIVTLVFLYKLTDEDSSLYLKKHVSPAVVAETPSPATMTTTPSATMKYPQ